MPTNPTDTAGAAGQDRIQGSAAGRWYSICSIHRERQADCSMCQTGEWISDADHAASGALFRSDYAEWFRQHNSGEEPGPSAWATWEQITGGQRP